MIRYVEEIPRYEKDDMLETKGPMNYRHYPLKATNPRCLLCEHSVMRYWTGRYGQYKSTLCTPGKVLVCIQGFIQPEEMELP